jgi:alkanesulfonate monooxygenase SsuD/methylene tetrahydromethanopterin reductase-like flavin-dependent oxidoreductase (luciferase family)
MGMGGNEGLSYGATKKIAKEAEEFGFDTILLPDEMFLTLNPTTECWTALTALACGTKRIRLGPYITCYNYRHPAVLAKMGATLDVISDGRLQFSLGACGWGQEVVHRAYGIEYPGLEERVERLKEAIRVIRILWSQSNANFNGRYYSIRDAICEPKPLQKPMEIWTGGSSDLLIKAAAEVADGWDTGFCTLAGFVNMSDKLDSACQMFGRDSRSIKRSMHWHTTLIGKSRDELVEKRKRYLIPQLEAKSKHPTRWIRELAEKEYVERRFLIGTPEEILDRVTGFIDRGCDALNFVFPDAVESNSLQLFSEGIISKIQ